MATAQDLRRENEKLMDQLIRQAEDEIRDNERIIRETEQLIDRLTRYSEGI